MKLALPPSLLGAPTPADGAVATRLAGQVPTRELLFNAVFHAMAQSGVTAKEPNEPLPKSELGNDPDHSQSESSQAILSEEDELEKADLGVPVMGTPPDTPRPSEPNKQTKIEPLIRTGLPERPQEFLPLPQVRQSAVLAPGLIAMLGDDPSIGLPIEKPARAPILLGSFTVTGGHTPQRIHGLDNETVALPENANKLDAGPNKTFSSGLNLAEVAPDAILQDVTLPNRLVAAQPPFADGPVVPTSVLPAATRMPAAALPDSETKQNTPPATTMILPLPSQETMQRPHDSKSVSGDMVNQSRTQARMDFADLNMATRKDLDSPSERVVQARIEPSGSSSLAMQTNNNLPGAVSTETALANRAKDPLAVQETADRLPTVPRSSGLPPKHNDNATLPPEPTIEPSVGVLGIPEPTLDSSVRDSAEGAALGDPFSARPVSATAMTPGLKPAILPQIAPHLADLASARSDQIEVTLSPDELGRVRLAATQTEHGVVLLVHAERPETLELMRRHISDLLNGLKDMGFADISYSDQQREQHVPEGDADAEDRHPTEAEKTQKSGQTIPMGGLDLRL